PRSALRTRMSATGARARLEGIVINSRHTIPVSPRARIGAACRRAAHPSPLIPAQARIRSPKQGPAFAGTSANEFTGEAAGLGSRQAGAFRFSRAGWAREAHRGWLKSAAKSAPWGL